MDDCILLLLMLMLMLMLPRSWHVYLSSGLHCCHRLHMWVDGSGVSRTCLPMVGKRLNVADWDAYPHTFPLACR